MSTRQDPEMATHLTWDELVPYERQQGGYWDYAGADVYGNGKTWVPVVNPAMVNEPVVIRVVRYKCRYCHLDYPEKQEASEHVRQCRLNPARRSDED